MYAHPQGAKLKGKIGFCVDIVTRFCESHHLEGGGRSGPAQCELPVWKQTNKPKTLTHKTPVLVTFTLG